MHKKQLMNSNNINYLSLHMIISMLQLLFIMVGVQVYTISLFSQVF